MAVRIELSPLSVLKKEASALVGGDTLENHHRKSPQP
jgi:hypothetical protein